MAKGVKAQAKPAPAIDSYGNILVRFLATVDIPKFSAPGQKTPCGMREYKVGEKHFMPRPMALHLIEIGKAEAIADVG